MSGKGWPKGRKRGPSPQAGKKQLALDPEYIEQILDDVEAPPEDRFVAVMGLLLDAMVQSANLNTARVGTRLRTFWEVDMQNTHIWTPKVDSNG